MRGCGFSTPGSSALVSTTWMPARRMARTSSGSNAVRPGPAGQPGRTHSTRSLRPLRSVRAAADGAYPSRAAVSSTRRRVASEIDVPGVPFST